MFITASATIIGNLSGASVFKNDSTLAHLIGLFCWKSRRFLIENDPRLLARTGEFSVNKVF